jgi:hypothetical protein
LPHATAGKNVGSRRDRMTLAVGGEIAIKAQAKTLLNMVEHF